MIQDSIDRTRKADLEAREASVAFIVGTFGDYMDEKLKKVRQRLEEAKTRLESEDNDRVTRSIPE